MSWLGFALCTAAAWRTWYLIAHDWITEPIRDRTLWVVDDEGYGVPRERLTKFVECPFCLGFWLSVAWVAGYGAATGWPGEPFLWVAGTFAVSAGVVAIDKIMDALDAAS